MSDTLATYRHSGKFDASALGLTVGAAVIAGFPLGLAYASFINWVPFIYLNMLATVAYGFFFGWLTLKILERGRVRHPGIAAACGLAVGFIALYFQWNGHIRTLFTDAPWLLQPEEIMRGMAYLYETGSWGMSSGESITGIPLAIVWVVEAGLIVGLAAMLPYNFVKETPFCEKTGCWLDESRKIDTLENITDATQLAALKSGDIMPIVAARPKADNAAVFTRLLLKRSPKCQVFCTLRVQDVTTSIDKKGNVQEKVVDYTRDLILPASMFDLVVKFEEFKPTAATSPMPKAPAGM